MITLLFAHIGTSYPRYLINNIERTRRLFPGQKIVLVGDKRPNLKWSQRNKVDFFPHENHPEFNSIFSFGEFDERFRGGYWRHTLERLLTLASLHKSFPQEKILHIESDVILFPNFPFDLVENLDKMAWMNFSIEADIASLVYSPSYAASKKFSEHIVQDFSEFGGSDMDVLYRIRIKNNCYLTLPTLSQDLLEFANRQACEKYISEMVNNSSQTQSGIFDALGLGMWISGIDPRNKLGVTKVHSREYIDSGIIALDPSRMWFELSDEGNLYIRSESALVPIYNLHIHSKDKRLLSAEWKGRIASLVSNRETSPKIIGFSPRIFFSLVVTNFKNRTFLAFIMHFPGIRKMKAIFTSNHPQQ